MRAVQAAALTLAVGTCFQFTSAVDKSKFRTCETTGFCNRNRNLQRERAAYSVDPNSIHYTGPDDAVFAGSLISDNVLTPLDISILLYSTGVARVRVTESAALGREPRWEADDVLMSSLQPSKGKRLDNQDAITPDTAKTADIIIAYGDDDRYVLAVWYSPFFVSVYVDGISTVTANSKGLLHFEQRRDKPTTLLDEDHDNNEHDFIDECDMIDDDVLLHNGKEVIDYGEDGLAIYSDGTTETIEEQRVRRLKTDKVLASSTSHTHTDDGSDDNTNKAKSNTNKSNNNIYDINSNVDNIPGLWEESFDGHIDSKPYGPMSIGIDIWFPQSYQVYGIPEHASSFALKSTLGNTPNSYTDPYRLYTLDVFEHDLDVPMALYGAIPYVISHSPSVTSGIFWFNPTDTFVDIQHGKDNHDASGTSGNSISNTVHATSSNNNKNVNKEKGNGVRWISETGVIDFMMIPGPTPIDVFKQYASLTGMPLMPAKFSLGYHQCRWNYKDEDDVFTVDKGFEDHDIPYDVLWLDIEHTNGKRYFTWDNKLFPNPIDMQNKLAEHGRKMVTIVDPHIKRDNSYDIHKEATSLGYYIKDKCGVKDFDGWCWSGSSSYLDFTNEKVRQWWATRFTIDKYSGSTYNLHIWNDMNEPSVFNGPEVSMRKDCKSINGIEHREWHNYYGMYMHRATAEGVSQRGLEPSKSNSKKVTNDVKLARPFVLSRAFGPGTQRWGAIWTGDNAAKWEHLRISIPMLLSMSVTGLSFIGADVGGFFGNPSPELFTRWMQAGAYQPFFRGHAHHDSKRREPWLFGEPWTTRLRAAIMSRYRLLPYWYTLFEIASRTGVPPMRPLWLHYTNEINTYTIEDQWLVGDALLVKPVMIEGSNSVNVYFPGHDTNTIWYDTDTYTIYKGSASKSSISVPAPIDKIPVYQRGGTIIPKQMRLRRSSSLMVNDPYTLIITLDTNKQATGTLYIDDGVSYDYIAADGHALTTYTYSNHSLKSSRTSGTQKVSNTIERIVIAGLQTAPSQVVSYNSQTCANRDSNEVVSSTNDDNNAGIQTPTCNSDGTIALEHQWDSSSKVLTIRKPDVPAADQFHIELKW